MTETISCQLTKGHFQKSEILRSTDVANNTATVIQLICCKELLPVVVVVLEVVTAVLFVETVGTRGNEEPKAGTEPGPNGIDGIEGPRGTGLLTAVLVNVDVPETLVRVGVARFSSLDVSGSCMEK